jgi:HEAT repeat protein
MNAQFQSLQEQVCQERIGASDFISQLRLLPDFSEELLDALRNELNEQNWSCLFKLIFAVQAFPHRKFTPILTFLLDNHRERGYSENIVDALFDINDEQSIPSLIRLLDYYEPGDDDRHVNKKAIYVLARIGTSDAIKGLKIAASNSDRKIKATAERELVRLKK